MKGRLVQSIMKTENIPLAMIHSNQGCATIAELLEDHAPRHNAQPLPLFDLMVFDGFSDDAIINLSTTLRKSGVDIERKCIVTKHNRSWQFAHLLREICDEQEYMNRISQCRTLLLEVRTYQESDYTQESWQRYELAFMSGALLLQQEHATKAQLDTVIQAIHHTRDQLEKKSCL